MKFVDQMRKELIVGVSSLIALVRKAYWKFLVPIAVAREGVNVGDGVRFYGQPILSLIDGSKIAIKSNVVICSESTQTALGVLQPTILRTMRANALIEIGEDTGISGAVLCAAIGINIGRECLIGSGAMIVDNDFHPIDPNGRRWSKDESAIAALPIHIGNNVFLGARTLVLKGVTIGDNSVIGAGSVVSKSIPSNCIAAGNPASPIRSIVNHEDGVRK